ncbi:hypothetical protein Tco_0409004 [Tanacetum coccineum]
MSHYSGAGDSGNLNALPRDCTTKDFHEMQTTLFQRHRWSVELTQWFEKEWRLPEIKLKGLSGIARHDPWKHRAFKPKTCKRPIEMATELMDKRVSTDGGEDKQKTRGSLNTLPECGAQGALQKVMSKTENQHRQPVIKLGMIGLPAEVGGSLKYSSRTDPETTEKSFIKQSMQAARRPRQKSYMLTDAYTMEFPKSWTRSCLRTRLGNGCTFGNGCHADEPLAVPLDGLNLDDKLHFVEEPVEIVDREVKRLKRSRIPLVKVRWNSKRGPEFTWEREDQFKKKYPHLFTKTTPSSSAAL